jgi:hypothetical protein
LSDDYGIVYMGALQYIHQDHYRECGKDAVYVQVVEVRGPRGIFKKDYAVG